MKILYLAAIRLPTEKAHGLQIMKTCEAFAAEGAAVELMVPTRRNAIQADPFEYYSIKVPPGGTFKITKIHVPDFMRIGFLGRVAFFSSLIAFAEAAHFTKAFWQADVIYSRDAVVLAEYVLLGRPLVYEAHTAPTIISKFVARRAKRVVVISHGLRLAYENAGVKKERIIVAPDAIDLSAFSPEREGVETKDQARTRLGLPLDKKIALYIGRLDGWKGVDTFCESAALLPEDTIAVVIGGEPEQVAAMKAKSKDIDGKQIAESKLHFLGYHPYQELANNQQAADVLVLPNTAKNVDSYSYTSPLKLFTYMASDRHIVASDLPSIREVLDDTSAFFFTPDDAHSLAQKITEALSPSNHEVSVSKAAKAREIVRSSSWHARARGILESIKNF